MGILDYGQRLKKLRESLGLSQKELTERLNLNRSTYARYETSSTQPDFDTLIKLADYFGVSTDFILTGTRKGQLMVDFNNPEELVETPEYIRFSIRLKNRMNEKGITVKDLANLVGLTEDFFEKMYLSGALMTRKDDGNLEIIADAVNLPLDYLFGHTNETISKNEKDIAKRLEKFKEDISNSDGLTFNGEPVSNEALESFIDSIEHIYRQTQRMNKKYTPKKYRDDE